MATTPLTTMPTFPVTEVRKDFPILSTPMNGYPLAYLDNAATTQKPYHVIHTLSDYYQHSNANIHRGVYHLSELATQAYEAARDKAQHFLHAPHREEIIFVRGATEAINLVANSFVAPQLKPDDEILISLLEHHSNIVPWQLIAARTGARLVAIPIKPNGELQLDKLDRYFTPRTKILAITHVSNALGTLVPLQHIIQRAHAAKVPVLVDGAQAVPHLAVDVQALDCDFYVFSGHKLYGPTGIGILYGKHALLDAMPPYHGGGDMILSVSLEKTIYNHLPYKFEAGTPAIAEAIGLGAAIDYVNQLTLPAIHAYVSELLQYATAQAAQQADIQLIGTAADKAAILSFVMQDVHPHDIATILDQQGIAVRSGHHCSMPTLAVFNLTATVRASFAFYNTKAEIDRLFAGLEHVRKIFHKV
jgi:cysteine desulfurase / selenocysteine lyase